MIKMVTWRTGGHQAPLRGSSICQSASSISMATSLGTWPMDFMYARVDNHSPSSFLIFQVYIEFTATFSQILSQTLFFVSFICFPVTFANLSVSIYPPVLQAHLFSASGVFNILCWHINPSPSLCLPSSVPLLWTMLLLSPGKIISCVPKSDICDLLKYRGKITISLCPLFLPIFVFSLLMSPL